MAEIEKIEGEKNLFTKPGLGELEPNKKHIYSDKMKNVLLNSKGNDFSNSTTDLKNDAVNAMKTKPLSIKKLKVKNKKKSGKKEKESIAPTTIEETLKPGDKGYDDLPKNSTKRHENVYVGLGFNQIHTNNARDMDDSILADRYGSFILNYTNGKIKNSLDTDTKTKVEELLSLKMFDKIKNGEVYCFDEVLKTRANYLSGSEANDFKEVLNFFDKKYDVNTKILVPAKYPENSGGNTTYKKTPFWGETPTALLSKLFKMSKKSMISLDKEAKNYQLENKDSRYRSFKIDEDGNILDDKGNIDSTKFFTLFSVPTINALVPRTSFELYWLVKGAENPVTGIVDKSYMRHISFYFDASEQGLVVEIACKSPMCPADGKVFIKGHYVDNKTTDEYNSNSMIS